MSILNISAAVDKLTLDNPRTVEPGSAEAKIAALALGLVQPRGGSSGKIQIFDSENQAFRDIASEDLPAVLTPNVATGQIGFATGAGGAVTQETSASTTVVLSKPTGQITTVALTTAGAAEEEFTVTNTLVAATDIVVVGTTYAGQGTPAVTVKGITAGSFKIVITNLSASALNAAVVINFAIIKGVAA